MARKAHFGYYVRGQFVHAGSELDQQLREETHPSDSKSARKRASDHLQELGEQLIQLPASRRDILPVPDDLMRALREAPRISDFEGQRRHRQYIGKLMRKLDDEAVEHIQSALQAASQGSAAEAAALHHLEHWRERLLSDDGAQTDWLSQHPGTDVQRLRALVRQARKDAQPHPAGEAPRHGKAYRELFQLLRQAQPAAPETAAPIDPQASS